MLQRQLPCSVCLWRGLCLLLLLLLSLLPSWHLLQGCGVTSCRCCTFCSAHSRRGIGADGCCAGLQGGTSKAAQGKGHMDGHLKRSSMPMCQFEGKRSLLDWTEEHLQHLCLQARKDLGGQGK